MSVKVELEQYKAWIVTLRERYQEVVAERDALRTQLAEQEAYTSKIADRCAELSRELTELREAAEAYCKAPSMVSLDALVKVLAKVKP